MGDIILQRGGSDEVSNNEVSNNEVGDDEVQRATLRNWPPLLQRSERIPCH
jgi:hypothetical protein